jgi:molecular chaperone DnaK
MYKAQQAAGGGDAAGGPGAGPAGGSGPGAGTQGKAGDDKVVDADFEEVDDQKKHRA